MNIDLVIGAGMSIVSAGLVYAGTRYTARSSKEASVATVNAAATRNVTDGYDRLNEDLWTSIRDLRERVATLETKIVEQERRYRIAIGYIRSLLLFIEHNGNAPNAPAIPDELGKDL